MLLCPEGFGVELLNERHDRRSFSCGKPQLDRFIKEQAGQGRRKGISATHVLVELENISVVVGYVSLASANIPFHDLPVNLARKLRLPTEGLMPATLIGRLAVDARYQKRGLGEFLLLYALETCHRVSLEVGSCMAVLDAIDEESKRWYTRYGFVPLTNNETRLVLPMGTIDALLSDTGAST